MAAYHFGILDSCFNFPYNKMSLFNCPLQMAIKKAKMIGDAQKKFFPLG